VLRGAAEEVLAVLKNDRLKDPEKQTEVESLLGTLPGEKFANLKVYSKLITDWAAEGEEPEGGGADNPMDT
jgi:pre-mRNA-splicing helicase BRR2